MINELSIQKPKFIPTNTQFSTHKRKTRKERKKNQKGKETPKNYIHYFPDIMPTNQSTQAEIDNLAVNAASGNLEEFQRLESLLKGEFDVNMVDEHGNTFLFAGSIGGHLHVVTYLMGKAA